MEDSTTPSAATAPHGSAAPQPPLALTNLFDLAPPPPWLAENRIPRGRITLLTGPSESGKTSIALDLANRLATGQPWPDPQPQPPIPCDLPAETLPDQAANTANTDAPTTTPRPAALPPAAISPRHPSATLILTPFQISVVSITPRLQQLNPHPQNIFYATGPWLDPAGPPADLAGQLSHTLRTHPEITLLIIDPILPMLASGLIPRRLLPKFLHDLTAMAAATGIAILATVPNLAATRTTPLSPLNLLASHAAAIYQLSFDLRAPDHRTLQTLKFTNQTPPPAMLVELAPHAIRYSLDESIPSLAPAARPTDTESDLSPGQIEFALDFLRESLTPGPLPASKILAMAQARRISARTLYRAKKILSANSYKITNFMGQVWIWSTTGQPDPADFDMDM